MAAVFAVEQLVGMLTIIGPAGSFIAPGPMSDFLGGGLFLGFLCALGFATALPSRVGAATAADTVPTADSVPSPVACP